MIALPPAVAEDFEGETCNICGGLLCHNMTDLTPVAFVGFAVERLFCERCGMYYALRVDVMEIAPDMPEEVEIALHAALLAYQESRIKRGLAL